MPTLSIHVTGRASDWLRRQSRERGIAPEAVVEELIARRQAADEFRALSDEAGTFAASQGLTPDVLGRLLDGDEHG